MRKSLLYKLFGFGRIPKEALPTLEFEGIVLLDEGLRVFDLQRSGTVECRFRTEHAMSFFERVASNVRG